MSQSHLSLCLLGSPLITINAKPITVDRRKAIALLAYLASTATIHQRQTLATLFWPEDLSQRAMANLRQTLWVTKRALKHNWLIADRETLSLAPGFDLDIHTFQQHLQTANTAFTQNKLPTAITHFKQATALYRDNFMAGFTLRDAPGFDEWQSLQDQHHKNEYEHALHTLTQIYYRQQDWKNTIHYAQLWLAEDPICEPAHVWLMRAYHRNGQKTAALYQYETLQRVFMTELGLRPRPETIQLYESILHNTSVEASTSIQSLPIQQTPLPPKLHLPLEQIPSTSSLPLGSIIPFKPNPQFVGRSTEMKTLASLLQEKHIVALTGMGGVGKTQLAIEFAYRYAQYFTGGVFWLNFSQPEAIANQVAQCGHQHGLALHPNFTQIPFAKQIELVQQAWEETLPRLLIFDNCETPELLQKWQPTVGGCHILITSRRGRWPAGQALITIPVKRLPRSDSTALLSQLLPHIEPKTAEVIAKEVGDLPLALHLVGCFLERYRHILSPRAYLNELRKQTILTHPSLTNTEGLDLPTGKKRNVARTFQLSFEQLHDSDKKDTMAKKILSILIYLAPNKAIPRNLIHKTVTRLSIESCPTTLEIETGLIRLLELGLLAEDTNGALWLHELLAQFIHSHMSAEETRLAVEAALIDALAKLKVINLSPSSQWAPHIRVMAYTARPRQDQQAATLSYWLGHYARIQGNYTEAKSCLAYTLQIRQTQLGEEHPETVQSLSNLGMILYTTGDFHEAFPYVEKALAICQHQLGEQHPDTISAHHNMGMLWHTYGDLAQAKQHYQKALSGFEKTKGINHPHTALTVNSLGVLLWDMGQLTPAYQYIKRAITIWEHQPIPLHPEIAVNLNNMGSLLTQMKQFQEAEHYLKRAGAIYRQFYGVKHPLTAFNINLLGNLYFEAGKLTQAQQHLERALRIHQNTVGSKHPTTADNHHNLGNLYLALGELELATQQFERALTVRKQVFGTPHHKVAHSFVAFGKLHEALNHNEEARKYYNQALSMYHRTLGENHFLTQRAQQRGEAIAGV